jgi:hypothetical protein
MIKAIIRFVMCDLLNQHWYEPTNYVRWQVTAENWVCRRCGKTIKSVKELNGTKGKLSF